MAQRAVERYLVFQANLKGQVEAAFREGANNANVRARALATCKGAARAYLQIEDNIVALNTSDVVEWSAKEANAQIKVNDVGVDLTVSHYMAEAEQQLLDTLAAQAQRDIATAMRHIQTLGLRTDIYMRSGRYSLIGATAQIASEENGNMSFTFMDRMGRSFKATKHIRDSFRLHLINVCNEVFLYTIAEHGYNYATVRHPDPNYKWDGQKFSIVDDGNVTDYPMYYQIQGEIFHPNSAAYIAVE